MRPSNPTPKTMYLFEPCRDCGELKRKKSLRCFKCARTHRSGAEHPQWKGGVISGKHTAGYVRVRVPGEDAYVMQHRMVMEAHLGRALLPDENVHHLNGDRADNRLDNLELWSTSQPPGQRVEDKVRWAKSMISRYETPATDIQGRLPIAIDFDGTLAHSLWTPEDRTREIGSPIRLNLVKAREVARAGWRIYIYTARPWEDEPMIRRWLIENEVPFDGVVCSKPLAVAYVDDRARHESASSWLP